MDITNRPRRLRGSTTIRNLVRETTLLKSDFIYPLFIVEGTGIKREIASMPGVYHFSIDMLQNELDEVQNYGIPGVILFGVPEEKDEKGSGACGENGIVQRALFESKKRFPELLFAADICLCEYTSHGHCGIVQNAEVLNDPTVELLAQISVSMAQAGADIIAPSDMMDGRIGEIRKALDNSSFEDKIIMAYSAKYSSAFYGPFRDAAYSKPAFGDRKTYQMDPANAREAIKEVELDIAQGADIVMVKPALAYLDIIRQVKDMCNIPVAAYNVSGEYSMIKAAAAKGWIDERNAAMEMLTSIKRAGADIILTYYAKQAVEWLNY